MKLILPDTVEGRREMFLGVMHSKCPHPFAGFLEALEARVPVEFYTAPSSSTGKYHPEHERGEGGLFMHTLSVVHMAEHLLRLYEVEDHRQQQAVLAAALFHDTLKSWNGVRWGDRTVANHGEACAGRIRDQWKLSGRPEEYIATMVETMASCVESHMVQWAYMPKHFDSQPPLVRLLSTADFCVSRETCHPW